MGERRFADRTTVTVDTTRSQIETMLRGITAERIVLMNERSEIVVAFTLDQKWIKILVPVPAEAGDQVRRAKWRALHMILKAKIEATAQGVTTVEQEFLAHIVLPEGQTVGDWLRPQLQLAYEKGQQPRLLPDYGGRS